MGVELDANVFIVKSMARLQEPLYNSTLHSCLRYLLLPLRTAAKIPTARVADILLRRSRHKVTGLQGLCALIALELENLVIVPTISPCNPSVYALNGR